MVLLKWMLRLEVVVKSNHYLVYLPGLRVPVYCEIFHRYVRAVCTARLQYVFKKGDSGICMARIEGIKVLCIIKYYQSFVTSKSYRSSRPMSVITLTYIL